MTRDMIDTTRGENPPSVMPAPLLTPDQVSEYLGVPSGTLANWRYLGQGPAFLRVGRHVRYRAHDIDTWVETRRADTSR